MEVHELAEIVKERFDKIDDKLDKVTDQTHENTKNIAVNKTKLNLYTTLVGGLNAIGTALVGLFK